MGEGDGDSDAEELALAEELSSPDDDAFALGLNESVPLTL